MCLKYFVFIISIILTFNNTYAKDENITLTENDKVSQIFYLLEQYQPGTVLNTNENSRSRRYSHHKNIVKFTAAINKIGKMDLNETDFEAIGYMFQQKLPFNITDSLLSKCLEKERHDYGSKVARYLCTISEKMIISEVGNDKMMVVNWIMKNENASAFPYMQKLNHIAGRDSITVGIKQFQEMIKFRDFLLALRNNILEKWELLNELELDFVSASYFKCTDPRSKYLTIGSRLNPPVMDRSIEREAYNSFINVQRQVESLAKLMECFQHKNVLLQQKCFNFEARSLAIYNEKLAEELKRTYKENATMVCQKIEALEKIYVSEGIINENIIKDLKNLINVKSTDFMLYGFKLYLRNEYADIVRENDQMKAITDNAKNITSKEITKVLKLLKLPEHFAFLVFLALKKNKI